MSRRSITELLRWLSENAEVKCTKDLRNQDSLKYLIDDSREVDHQTGFLALRTPTGGDGHRYALDALRRGAPIVIGSDQDLCSTLDRYVAVQELESRLPALLRWFYNSPDEKLRLIGVTGTNGKTTVTTLTERTLSRMGHLSARLGTITYFDGEREWKSKLTTPTLPQIYEVMARALTNGCRYMTMEVSSHGLSLGRLGDLKFHVVAFTNLSQDHLDFHGDMDNYFKAKLKLFTEHSWRYAIVHLRDEYGIKLLQELRASSGALIALTENPNLISSSSHVEVVRYHSVNTKGLSVSFTVELGSSAYEVRVPMLGRFNAENLAIVLTILWLLGLNIPEVIELWRREPDILRVSGRMEVISYQPLVIIDYSHTPDALERAIKSIRLSFPKERLKVVFGAGGNRDRAKRPLMGLVASTLADEVIVTSDNPRDEAPEDIIADILKGIPEGLRKKVKVIVDRREAIREAILSSSGEIVLIAGKGHEDYQEVRGKRYHLSDREEAKRALERRKVRGRR